MQFDEVEPGVAPAVQSIPQTAHFSIRVSAPASSATHPQSTNVMLSYALLFFIIAIIAAALGFGGLAGTSATIAKVLFVVFLVLFLISLVTGRRPRP